MMTSPITRLVDLPPGAKVGVAVMSGMSLVGLMYLVMQFASGRVVWILAIGVAVVAIVLGLYRWILKRRDKGKSKPLERKLAENTAATPTGVSDASQRARVDDLRKKFQEGVATFHEHGKDMYSLPWYLLVGEPGSGKTEAIRHCNVGFPPGLQNDLQGAGGTLNMNWWFTNHSVILDTAGRLMFEEVEAGATGEWKEFLKQLRTTRPNCPINGMLLVIPADSLIKDTAEELERKGGKIARQLDTIQRTLGVRFPVFVVITKSDLINGFREFFDGIDDPQLQHQILGWSNPGELDDQFDPARVEEHLLTVRQRLRRRRLAMLLDPVAQDPDGWRFDEVDALYAFPESLTQVAPRLRRYLEMIFVAGEWATKPLFLRGIYFTSSMREGSALDTDLADALGVSIDSLPEGRVWEKDRAYFLRELFMEKVFKEKGLVTRATNARQLQRRRRAILLGSTVAMVAILFGLTIWGAWTFRQRLGMRQKLWTKVEKEVANPRSEKLRLLTLEGTRYQYEQEKKVKLGSLSGRPGQVIPALRKDVETPIKMPMIFRPVAIFAGDVNKARKKAYARLFELSVLEPAAAATAERMRTADEATGWSSDATAALAQLVRIESASVGHAGDDRPPVEIGPLYRFVLGEEGGYDTFDQSDAAKLQATLEWIWGNGGLKEHWPGRGLESNKETLLQGVRSGVQRFLRYWQDVGIKGDARFGAVLRLSDALTRFDAAESALGEKVGFDKAMTSDSYTDALRRWNTQMGLLRAAAKDADEAIAALGDSAGLSVDRLVAQAAEAARTGIEAQFDALGREFPPEENEAAAKGDQVAVELVKEGAQIARLKERVLEQLDAQRQKVLAELTERSGLIGTVELGGEQPRIYAVRARMYEAADEVLKTGDLSSSDDALDAIGSVDSDLDDAKAELDRLASADAGGTARGTCASAVSAAGRRMRRELAGAMLAGYAGAEALADLATTDATPLTRPTLPLTAMAGGEFDPAYHPDAAGRLFGGWSVLSDLVSGSEPVLVLDAGDMGGDLKRIQPKFEKYVQDYVRYWSRTVPGEATPGRLDSWQAYREKLRTITDQRVVADELVSLDETIARALDVFGGQHESGVGVLLSERLSEDVNQTLQRLADERNELENERYLDHCWDVVKRWQDLPESVEEARRAVLREDARDFLKDSMPEGLGSARGGVSYWDGLFLSALGTLADDAHDEAQDALSQLKGMGKAFPLCANASGDLSADDVALLARAAAKIGSMPAATGSGGKTIGGGAKTNNAVVDDLLDDLRGGDLLGADREWLAKVTTVLGLLGDSEAPLTGTLVILPYDEQPGRGTAGQWRVFAVDAGGDKPRRFNTDRVNEDTGVEVSIPSGSSLRFDFYKLMTDQRPGATATLASPWTLLRAVHSDQAVAPGDDGASKIAGVWKLPVRLRIEDSPGEAMTYWIGIRFNRGVPASGDWPVEKDWPAQ